MNSGVYVIRNNANGRMYVGASMAIRERFTIHLAAFCAGRHDNKEMQADCNTYGPESFEFSVYEFLSDEESISNLEQDVIKLLKSEGENLYNKHKSPFLEINKKSRSEGDPIDIGALRFRLGISQSELAERIGVRVDTVRKYEQGHRIPSRSVTMHLKALEASQPIREVMPI